MDVDQVRICAHVGVASLLAALSIVTWLLRGKSLVLHRALLASVSFGLASAWFWGLSATVKEHAIWSRADLLPVLAVVEFGFMFLGWAWFLLMWSQTFVIVRRHTEVTS